MPSLVIVGAFYLIGAAVLFTHAFRLIRDGITGSQRRRICGGVAAFIVGLLFAYIGTVLALGVISMSSSRSGDRRSELHLYGDAR